MLIAAALTAAAIAFWPRHGASEVKHLVKWPRDCADVKIESDARPPYLSHWRGVTDHDLIECEMLGPTVFYARFVDAAARGRSLRAAPPADPVCVYGDAQLVVDGLDSRAAFTHLCDRLDGRMA